MAIAYKGFNMDVSLWLKVSKSGRYKTLARIDRCRIAVPGIPHFGCVLFLRNETKLQKSRFFVLVCQCYCFAFRQSATCLLVVHLSCCVSCVAKRFSEWLKSCLPDKNNVEDDDDKVPLIDS